MRRFVFFGFVFIFIGIARGGEKPPVASWSFDQVSGADDIRGFRKFVAGAAGKGLRFDGQTTAVVRGTSKAPRLGGAFSIEAWVAIQTLPWTWCAAVLPLAKSWLSPPRMEIAGDGFDAAGYDPTQRAFVLSRRGPSASSALSVLLRASEESPVVNPVLLISGWGQLAPRVEIDGRPAPLGPDVRAGHIHGLESDDLVLWIRKESTSPVRIAVSPSDDRGGK